MNRKTSWGLLAIGLAILLIAPAAMAQQQYVFPQKGQTADQQKKDEYDCHGWAVKQTGFDPTAAAQAPAQQAAAQPAGAQPGSGAKGAARGAVAGAAIGSLDGEAGERRRSRGRCRGSGRPGAEQKAGVSAAGTGSAAGIDSAERKTAGLSPGKGRLPRGERLLGEVERVSDCPCLSHKTGIGDRRMSKAESTNGNREG